MQSVVDGLLAFSGRGACTDAERRAALWLHDELLARGHEAWVETRWVRPQRNASIALGSLLAVAGGLLSTAAAVAGLAVAVAGALVLALEAAGVVLFPRRATQDVLTTPGDGTPLVIVAAYDAPRDRWRRLLRRRWWLAACAVVVAGAAGARVAGIDATWLGAVQLVPTVVLLLAVGAAIDAALSGFPDDDPSGVAVALALHDELRRNPPRALAPALLLVGAGHAARRPRIEGVVLELGPAGIRITGRGAHRWPESMDAALDLALDVVDDFSAVARAASRPA